MLFSLNFRPKTIDFLLF